MQGMVTATRASTRTPTPNLDAFYLASPPLEEGERRCLECSPDHVGFVEPWFQFPQGDPLVVTPFVTRWSPGAPSGTDRVLLTLHDIDNNALGAPLEVAANVDPYGMAVLAPVTRLIST